MTIFTFKIEVDATERKELYQSLIYAYDLVDSHSKDAGHWAETHRNTLANFLKTFEDQLYS